MMSETVMSMTYLAMKVALIMAGPLLLVTLVVGLVISIFQAATQINEMTLSFIPKLLAVGAALVLLGPWLITTMVDYMRTLFTQIPGLRSEEHTSELQSLMRTSYAVFCLKKKK